MKAVVQRVSTASVEVEGCAVGSIGAGLLVLAAVEEADTPEDRSWTAEKLAHLRIFPDAAGKMNRSVLETGGGVLLVSNFTVAGDVRRGRRPSFDGAMKPPGAEAEFNALVEAVRALGVPVETGRFGAHMLISLVNDGPVTIVLDSAERSRPRGG